MVYSGLLSIPSFLISTSLDLASSRSLDSPLSSSTIVVHSFFVIPFLFFPFFASTVPLFELAAHYDLTQTAFHYLAGKKEWESVARWSFGFVKAKCAVCNTRCCNTDLQAGPQWLENTRFSGESAGTYRIDNDDDKGDHWMGQTRNPR